jgi:hypothetical protein
MGMTGLENMASSLERFFLGFTAKQKHWILPVSLACILAWNLSGMEEAGIEGRRRFDAGCRVQQTGLSGHLSVFISQFYALSVCKI